MKTVFRFIFLLTVCLFFPSCSNDDSNNDYYMDDDYKAKYTSDQIHDRLKGYIDNGQTTDLEAFFKEWNSSVASNSAKYVNQNDTIRQAHRLYKAFYDPLNLNKLGDSEWGNDLYKDSKYFVVQNDLYYIVVFSPIPENSKEGLKEIKGHLKNFRPELGISKSKILYLTPEYDEGIRSLIDSELPRPMNSNNTTPKENITYKYSKALGGYMPLIMGHWGNVWHLETHPVINTIIFNQNMTKAKVDFRIVFEGGEATFERVLNTWVLKESHMTWIE